jgi:hypothetical protein
MKLFLYQFVLLLSLAFLSCYSTDENDIPTQAVAETVKEVVIIEPPSNNIIDPPMETDTTQHQKSYKRLLKQMKRERSALRLGLDNGTIELDSVGNYFTRIMRDSIFYYWYGTPWDFNGYTNTPRDGLVACGYFISTPLKHIGLNVNRYKLAQQGAEPMILSVNGNAPIFQTIDLLELETYLNSEPADGLYVIGLSYHVGYILRENGENFMVHSDYNSPVAVCKKSFATCEALHSSGIYVLGKLSGNADFLNIWLRGTRVAIGN